MSTGPIKYTPEELAWVQAHSTLPRADMHRLFIETFQRPEINCRNLQSLCKRNGWMTGRTGRFEAGSRPFNAGKKMPDHVREKVSRTMFKPGQLPHNAKGHGHERVDRKDGYVIMIVDEANPWSGAKTRPVHKHRYLWEQMHGPVPEGHVLKCIDGNKLDTDPSNWVAVPRGLLPRLNGRWASMKYDDAPAELKPTLMLIAKIKQAAMDARKAE